MPQTPIAGASIPQFVDPLPTLAIAPQNGTMTTIAGSQPLAIRMCEFKAKVLPSTFVPPAGSTYAGFTWVWGYLPEVPGLGSGQTCEMLVDWYDDKQMNGTTGPLDTYIGPVVVNERNAPTEVTWINDLGASSTTKVIAYRNSTDQTLHWADPLAPNYADANQCMRNAEFNLYGGQSWPPPDDPCAWLYDGPVPAAPHLHGAEDPAEVDGSPDSWFTSDGQYVGHKYYSKDGLTPKKYAIYTYPNTQEAAPLWFHDHTLGATRLNVYMGLAGAYFIEDPNFGLPPNLHPLEEVIPLVLQDRSFDTNGQFFVPADSYGGVQWAPNPEHPYWVPEFVGDSIVINGKAWPYLQVEPKRYRFLFLNGSNARTYEMFLTVQGSGQTGPPLWVIGTDGGYLDAPMIIDPKAKKPAPTKLIMMPGERYEVIVDFSLVPSGTNLLLKNVAKTPYPAGGAPQGSTLGQMMQVRVGPCTSGACGATDPSYDPAAGVPLRSGAPGSPVVQRLVNPATGTLLAQPTLTRQLTLNEVMGMGMTVINPVTGLLTTYPGGPLEILVNNTKWSGMVEGSEDPRNDFLSNMVNGVMTYFSETPTEGTTELWEIVNTTADAHPIHLHLVQFQLLNRQAYNTNKYTGAYAAAFGSLPAAQLPAPLPTGCTPGFFCPGYGPPLPYDPASNPLSLGKYGGNPAIDPYLQGPVRIPLPHEAGWKDTVVVYPGEVTRLAVRWAPNDLPLNTPAADLAFPFDPSGQDGLYNYVWHCHIIDHEDNEMMRPDLVYPNPAATTRSFTDY